MFATIHATVVLRQELWSYEFSEMNKEQPPVVFGEVITLPAHQRERARPCPQLLRECCKWLRALVLTGLSCPNRFLPAVGAIVGRGTGPARQRHGRRCQSSELSFFPLLGRCAQRGICCTRILRQQRCAVHDADARVICRVPPRNARGIVVQGRCAGSKGTVRPSGK